jgi:hypothetical protein
MGLSSRIILQRTESVLPPNQESTLLSMPVSCTSSQTCHYCCYWTVLPLLCSNTRIVRVAGSIAFALIDSDILISWSSTHTFWSIRNSFGLTYPEPYRLQSTTVPKLCHCDVNRLLCLKRITSPLGVLQIVDRAIVSSWTDKRGWRQGSTMLHK